MELNVRMCTARLWAADNLQKVMKLIFLCCNCCDWRFRTIWFLHSWPHQYHCHSLLGTDTNRARSYFILSHIYFVQFHFDRQQICRIRAQRRKYSETQFLLYFHFIFSSNQRGLVTVYCRTECVHFSRIRSISPMMISPFTPPPMPIMVKFFKRF